jgi:hypothetical protein
VVQYLDNCDDCAKNDVQTGHRQPFLHLLFAEGGHFDAKNEIQTFTHFLISNNWELIHDVSVCGRSRSTLSSLSNRNLWSEKKLAIVSRFTLFYYQQIDDKKLRKVDRYKNKSMFQIFLKEHMLLSAMFDSNLFPLFIAKTSAEIRLTLIQLRH